MKKGSEKWILMNNFKNSLISYNPEFIIQHPHTTDTSKIWINSWQVILQQFPDLFLGCSGICYDESNNPRENIKDVISKTTFGKLKTIDIIDF